MRIIAVESRNIRGPFLFAVPSGAFAFHYVLRGTARLSGAGPGCLDNQSGEVHEGSFFVTRPTDSQKLTLGDEGSLALVSCRCDLESGDADLVSYVEGELARRESHDVGVGRRTLFETLAKYHDSGNEFLRKAAAHELVSFLYSLQIRVEAPAWSAHVHAAVGIFRDSLCDPPQLSDVADSLGISPSYLVRLFKRDVGRSPMAFFNELRLDAAADLLVQSKLRVYEVAERFCFADEYYFSNVFKKHKGMSPHRYRQRYRRLDREDLCGVGALSARLDGRRVGEAIGAKEAG